MEAGEYARVPDADHGDVVRAGDGVVLRMSGNVAVTLRDVLERLARLLRDGRLPEERRGWRLRRPATADEVLRRMFPNAYTDSAHADWFRQRHLPALRAGALAATERVLGRWGGAESAYLDLVEVDDWLMVLGLARFLFSARAGGGRTAPGVGSAAGQAALTTLWLNFLLERFVLAVCPSLLVELGRVGTGGGGDRAAGVGVG
ncbi:DUF2017 family protein [Goodfellowiella coeruleoviolacea]|uniref:Uncharacterized protein n=1 Tax=Goodfellowiella coeruleoviolacea TaxID=334858 RepID=A0AAE3KI98_9PSEU|nr:DUF2017 family protein [Goodfellowiella coeruleoviolacea]MCP2167752.1 protein of unknown function (DUF2017) [Goodfellowiella coeruleoviolacea]